MLAAVDDSTGDLFKALESKGQLDQTLIIFTADHGYFYGEHGLSVERRLAYEEGIRIPMLMRYPPLIKPGTIREQIVLSLDLAPTLLELSGAPIPAGLHGKSVAPLFQKDVTGFRSSFLIERWSDNVFPRVAHMGYKAVRTERWKLIHYTELTGMDEFYDLQNDAYEMKNLVSDPASAGDLRDARAELQRLLKDTASDQ
jgi:N-acetylglucosamine-6-sulfatase